MKRLSILFIAFCIIPIFSSCGNRSTPEEETEILVSVRATPVITGDIYNEISFNGRTVYLKKNLVVSPISGFVVKANVRFGQEVQKEDILFEIETKESRALASEKSTSGDFRNVKVRATASGFINELNINEAGAYIQEGGSLCNIVDNNDLMVKVNVPFEYNSVINEGRGCKISMADNTTITGSVFRILPVVDEVNQTQTVLIKPATNRQLPENLNLTIRFINKSHPQALLVSRTALMANETQSEYWVMKIDKGNMAIKIPVTRGLTNDTVAEVISPILKADDLIITEGAYGLSDSTSVEIVK